MVQINNEDLKQVRSEFLDTPKYRNTQNAVMNQKQSGRCWDFSGLNFIRYHVEKEHQIKDMELSGTYVYFYDKLEKAKLINQATEIAKATINNATTNSAVTAAENKGIEDIANVNVPSLAETKQAAIDTIKQVQKAKNSQIEEAKNLSADEQKNLIDQVNKIAQDAINKLNDPATTTNEVITDTRDKAIDQITNLFIPTLDSVQKDAQEAKIDEINKADNLTDQMKQNLIDQVNQVADNATKAINNAQTNDDVKEAETKGLVDIK